MGQGGKITVVRISLASIQSRVQNVVLFCKKRFMIFKVNLVNLKKKDLLYIWRCSYVGCVDVY